MKWSAWLAGVGFAALAITSTVTTAVPAQAQRWEDCGDRIRHAERHLDRMIERFGRHSSQAREARHDLERTREWCSRNRHRDRYRDGDRRDRHDGWGR